MKRIKLEEYTSTMGKLIDLSSPVDFMVNPTLGAENIPYQKFMLYYDKYLNKDNPYFFICNKGIHSGKVVRMLEYFGYNVTQVVRDTF